MEFNLGWNKTRWQIEESDEPIVSGDLFGTARLPTYEMPTQFKQLEWAVDHYGGQHRLVTIGPELVTRYAQIRDDKGPEVRAKIVAAYEQIVETAIRELKQEGQMERLSLLEKLWPKVRKKLVWKKVA